MKLEFHQLNRRYEHLRVQRADEQRRLMASLAASGQQTPIVVVAISGTPDSYLVIDGYKRIAALEHLGKDRVEAVIWPMSESEALVLDCSMRLGQRHTALEEGWRLQELRDRFGYTSYGTVHKHLRLLRSKGYLEGEQHQKRGLRMTDEEPAAAAALPELPFLGRIAAGRPILIFPEGTRVPPGHQPPLQPGFAGLYRSLRLPVVPVALDSGRLWPPHSFVKQPGIVTARFGEPIPAGLPRAEIEAAVHAAINQLDR